MPQDRACGEFSLLNVLQSERVSRGKALECSLKCHQNPGLGGVSSDSEPSADGQERALQQTGKDVSSQVSSQLSNLD